MAYVAAATDAGTRKQVNEDSCCIKVAQTSLGEVVMALVCDGVGGLSAGNLASATVVNRFSQWFDGELPMLMEGMVNAGAFDFQTVKAVWSALLQAQNDLIFTHGTVVGQRLGTTFTAIICCGGRYLIGHVGDCRAYRIGKDSFEQITEDQTKVARMLANGEITAEEAKSMPRNVILQSVGTQRVLAPVFYEGECSDDDLLVICCDGAYHRVENEGIRRMFQKADFMDEASLDATCREIIQLDLSLGEKDNLTVACFCTASAPEGEAFVAGEMASAAAAAVSADEDDMPTMVESDEDDMPTMVESDEDGADEDDISTMVESDEADADEDEMPTMVESDEDDMPTMVESDEADADEDEMPTMVESDEDDMPTMVESDEDDMPTMVESDEDGADEDWEDEGDDFDLPTFSRPAKAAKDDQPSWVDADEDDLPTMVEGEGADA